MTARASTAPSSGPNRRRTKGKGLENPSWHPVQCHQGKLKPMVRTLISLPPPCDTCSIRLAWMRCKLTDLWGVRMAPQCRLGQSGELTCPGTQSSQGAEQIRTQVTSQAEAAATTACSLPFSSRFPGHTRTAPQKYRSILFTPCPPFPTFRQREEPRV